MVSPHEHISVRCAAMTALWAMDMLWLRSECLTEVWMR